MSSIDEPGTIDSSATIMTVRRTIGFLLGSSLAVIALPQTQPELVLHEGDLLFQHIGGEQGHAIELATNSHWTHVGIAMLEDARWVVIEAVGPVKRTPLPDWIEQGQGHFAVKRLVRNDGMLTAIEIGRIREAADRYTGVGYDFEFQWSDDLIYCSELVWKVFEGALGVRLCEPKPMRAFRLSDPAVRRVMRERFGDAPPLDEPMMAPSTLFECPLLILEHEQ